LHLADSPYFGGITSHILSVAEAFRDDPDWEIVIATLPGKRNDRTLFERAEAAGLDVVVMEMASTFDTSVRDRLREYVESSGVVGVHTHAYRANVIANLSPLSVPVITTSHGLAVQPAMRLRLWQSMHLRFMRSQRNVIACSAFVSKTLQNRGVAAEKIHVIYNATSAFDQGREKLSRVDLDIEPNRVIALYVGRLDAGKRVDQLIRSVEGLPKYHVLIVGDGPARESLEVQSRNLGISIAFAGVKPDPNPYYALADVVVLPTEMEALPMTLIEAASHGKSVIATNVGGVPEVVVDGETGILVDGVDEVDGWVDALERLSDEGTRTRLGAAARARHDEAFSLESLRCGLAAVYEASIGRD
jgi:glycosyltransferase involved in cell wall biosynthesis